MLQNEDILKYGSINGWSAYENGSGALEWFNEQSPFIVLATPNWVKDGEVPVEVMDEEGEYNELPAFNIDLNQSVEEQLYEYIFKLSLILANY